MHARSTDRCDLCGAHLHDAGVRMRLAHLKEEHPAYARGVLLRVFAPAVYVAELLLIALFKSPQWVYVVALFSSFAMLFMGKQFSRAERRKAGARPVLPFVTTLRQGGIYFLLFLPMIALVISFAGKK